MQPVPVLLMVRELGLGGSERQAAEIARSLDRERFEPHVGCFRPNGFRAEELRAAGVPVVEFPVRSFMSVSAVRGAAAFASYVRRNRIQVVHSFDYPMNQFAVPAGRAFGAPRVLSSQRAHRELAPGLSRHLLRLTDQLADAIVVNCVAVKRHLIEDEKVPPGRIQICYNGFDTSVFQPVRGPRPAALEGAGAVVGVVCALRAEKNLELLLRAFASIKDAAPGSKLAVVGSGSERDRLVATAGELGLGSAVHFEPATGNVAEWLRGIDVFVLPSVSEALSNSLIEAMATGCCAIASDVGGNPELIDNGRTGLLFRSGDAGDLAACLRLAIESPELRNRLAHAGADRMHKEFSLQASARRMGEIYEAVLKA